MIRIESLSKKYGKHAALSGIDLYIRKGSVFGFVGPNGAGKTTTMSILATLLKPTSGKAYVGDYEVTESPREVRQLIGYMPDFFGVYDNLKTTEYLEFYAGAYDIPKQKQSVLIRDLLNLVNLEEKSDSYVDLLSRGMKQRLALARCLVHDPEVLLLDEPASGLDPRARIELKGILKELGKMGKTILISSHILPELAEMCTDIGVIEAGKLVTVGKVEEIAHQVYGDHLLKIEMLPGTSTEMMRHAAQLVKSCKGAIAVKQREQLLLVTFDGNAQDQSVILQKLVQEAIPVVSLAEDAGNLEDIFLAITNGVGS